MWPGARTPPTEPLNRVSPVNTSVPSMSSESIPAVWPGVWIGSISRAPEWIGYPRLHRAGRRGDLTALERVNQHGHAGVLLEDRVELRDVVVVMMGEQHVGERELAASQDVEQRLHRPAGVDQHRIAAELVSHEIRVRQPGFVH